MASQVSNLRDSAVEIMSKTTEYQILVEPKLALLNERWQELLERLRVCSYFLPVFQTNL